jgi:hypothetical protein
LLQSAKIIKWIDNKWIAGGWLNDSIVFVTSANGIDWTELGLINGKYFLDDLIYDGTKYILSVHDYSIIGHVIIYTSTTGETWNISAEIPELRWVSDIVHFNGNYIIAGQPIHKPEPHNLSMQISTDCVNWTPVDCEIGDVYKIVESDGTLIVGGIPKNANMTAYSIDGTNWTPNGLLDDFDEIDGMSGFDCDFAWPEE